MFPQVAFLQTAVRILRLDNALRAPRHRQVAMTDWPDIMREQFNPASSKLFVDELFSPASSFHGVNHFWKLGRDTLCSLPVSQDALQSEHVCCP